MGSSAMTVVAYVGLSWAFLSASDGGGFFFSSVLVLHRQHTRMMQMIKSNRKPPAALIAISLMCLSNTPSFSVVPMEMDND